MRWWKCYTKETEGDGKLGCLSLEEIGAWARVQSRLAESPIKGWGYLTEKLKISDRNWAKLLRISIRKWRRIKAKFLKFELYERDEKGALGSRNWHKYQSDWERVKKYQEDKKV